jgi:hypothetical protein
MFLSINCIMNKVKEKRLKDGKWHAYHSPMARSIHMIAAMAKQLARTTSYDGIFLFFKKVMIS